MNPKTSPQHRAPYAPNVDQFAAEYDAMNWKRMNGTVLPGWGRHRKTSIMAAPESEAEAA